MAFVAVAGVGAWAWWNGSVGSVPIREHCTALTTDGAAEVDPEQAGNAAIIAAVAVRRGMPGRAASIGIATALQESKLRNIDYGDRDSLGLFQQRPSQGWGTRKQISDPVYATNAFYDVLAKVKGYERMPITEVAQKVQRSAFPEAYAYHEPEAKALASTLAGYTPGGFSCVLRPTQTTAQAAGSGGLTARADRVRSASARETGYPSPTVLSPNTLQFTAPGASAERNGWALAAWAVARAQDLDVVKVQVAGRLWKRSDSTAGWTATPATAVLPTGRVKIQVA